MWGAPLLVTPVYVAPEVDGERLEVQHPTPLDTVGRLSDDGCMTQSQRDALAALAIGADDKTIAAVFNALAADNLARLFLG